MSLLAVILVARRVLGSSVTDMPKNAFLTLGIGFAVFALSTFARSTSALADEGPQPTPSSPRIGGHLGIAVPVLTMGDRFTAIGADFVSIGITPGVTVKLDERWSIDFEFIAMNELKRTPAATTFIVDPGVVYNAGAVSAGLRVATQVGAPTNVGLVPIVVLPFRLRDGLAAFIEGDVPMFLRDGGDGMQPSIGFQFQSGIAS
ncbi:MAG: hypothetical protein KF850_04750 [Labilithrix sp.]|nr:hypothetical protein [Labilithrix sp.]